MRWISATMRTAPDWGTGRALMRFRNCVNPIDVPSVDTYADNVVKGGGQIVVPEVAVPGVGWLIYCKDTEGNVFGMMQNDRNAK
jgi:predicted enzyme related to lactoylglutathione lyase